MDKKQAIINAIKADFKRANKRDPKDDKELAQFVLKQGGEKYVQKKALEVVNPQTAAHGAKLNYFKSLKNQCAEDEEVVYYKKGGSVGCGCKKKENGGEVKKDCGGSAIAKFKAARAQSGTKMMQLVEANKERKAKQAKEKVREDKWRKGQIIVGQDLEKGQKPKAKAQTDQAQADNKGIGKNKCGSKIKKHQEGSVIAQFKMHRLGGSLNGIPFMQAGTSKGGVKWKTSPRPDYTYNGKPVYPPTKYSPEIGNAEKHYLIDPYSETLLDSSESNFMNDLEDTRHPMGGYDASYELAKDWDTNSEKYRKNPILVSGFVSDLIGNRGFGRRVGSSWGNAYPHNPGWIKKPLFKKGYYYRY